ncbi:UDP-N-acetylmuramoylalanyl-D-glutamyl-2,6-diamin opimelate/D-alanyl-D-alanylligase [Desulfarculus baarsii DSM 2075]|uniref:UDP-N-acetylmuramoyl-tripeptide--D-alanyl-D-alanine ligase n=1 Tax=Desulfarculus baarsii (strain ATCC 33931 / DSM 2075 / LMG 7858 / VKM B-1802 / 2st14) TaxID=644282 RepID=E1QMA0_DESB2|nr:UDP-N-acetylmuramoyl-tripeptide--D-alanyl-D-alanine ligase [Desulfarculus baarsii]ADK86143.1 UDP-N-acetylmuramoylalanyl-D-glutamyl-2,6-diamin opimelate/D-alanyl-D-alanylligase [Desulfarculus baarsii DSM 2075]
MPALDAQFVIAATGAELTGQAPAQAMAGVCTDSRTIAPGQLFVALKGENFDGHDFVEKALQAGAAAALVERGFNPTAAGQCLLRVDDTTKALGRLAAAWRAALPARIVAVTGSNGKTSTKEMIAQVLGQRFEVHKTKGNLNNHIGLPLTLLALRPEHQVCVAEMGMNAPGEIAYLAAIARPDVAVITNVGPAHLGPLGSIEAVAAAKAELFQALGPEAVAAVNLDDPLLAPWADKLPCRVITFGLDPKAQARARDVSAFGSRQAFTMEIGDQPAERVRLAAPGLHNVRNALAAAAVGAGLGLEAWQIKDGVEAFTPTKGRLENVFTKGGPLLIDDTYNANPASVAAGLQSLAALSKWGKGHGLIMGDMGELGPEAPRLHRQVGRQAVEFGCKFVLAVGQMADEVVAGAREAGLAAPKALAFAEVDQLIDASPRVIGEGWTVLVKGSRAARMERVIQRLQEVDWENA